MFTFPSDNRVTFSIPGAIDIFDKSLAEKAREVFLLLNVISLSVAKEVFLRVRSPARERACAFGCVSGQIGESKARSPRLLVIVIEIQFHRRNKFWIENLFPFQEWKKHSFRSLSFLFPKKLVFTLAEEPEEAVGEVRGGVKGADVIPSKAFTSFLFNPESDSSFSISPHIDGIISDCWCADAVRKERHSRHSGGQKPSRPIFT